MAFYQNVATNKEETSQQESSPSISWRAPEYIYREKNPDWYWILGIVTIALIVIAFLLNNLLFAIFILLAGFTVALYGSRKPEILPFLANNRGIQMKRQLYPYQTLDAFWIDETDNDEALLILESKKSISPHILMPLGDVHIAELRNFLSEHLPEEYIERPWTQLLMDRFHF